MARSEGRPNAHSPTALATYQACPAQYEFQYIKKELVEDEHSVPLYFGNVMHQVMAFLYGLPLEDRSVDAAQQALRVFWSKGDRSVFSSKGEEAAWGTRGLEALEWYCSNHDLMIRPLVREDFVRAQLPNGQILFGKVDRVDRFASSGEEGIEVIDYKTGKCRIDDDDLPRELAAQHYALVCQLRYGLPVLRVRFIYLVDSVDRYWEPEQEDIDQIQAQLSELTEQVTSDTEFVATPSEEACRFCRYRLVCPDVDATNLADISEVVDVGF